VVILLCSSIPNSASVTYCLDAPPAPPFTSACPQACGTHLTHLLTCVSALVSVLPLLPCWVAVLPPACQLLLSNQAGCWMWAVGLVASHVAAQVCGCEAPHGGAQFMRPLLLADRQAKGCEQATRRHNLRHAAIEGGQHTARSP